MFDREKQVLHKSERKGRLRRCVAVTWPLRVRYVALYDRYAAATLQVLHESEREAQIETLQIRGSELRAPVLKVSGR